MKNVKRNEIFCLDENVQKILIAYYNNEKCTENSFNGSDEELLNVLKCNFSTTFVIYSNNVIMSFLGFECDKAGYVNIKYSNMFSRDNTFYNLHIKDFSCRERKITASGKLPKVVEDNITTLVYLFDFKLKYPYTVEKFKIEIASSRLAGYKNSHTFTIDEDVINKIVYFPFLNEIEKTDVSNLPEFSISFEAINLIDKKVGEEYLEEEVIYPFSEFVINIEGNILLCRLNSDKTMLRVLLKDKNKKSIFVANCNVDTSFGFTLLILKGFPKEYKDPRKFAANFLVMLVQILYYYSHYKIECEVSEKNYDENNDVIKKANRNYNSKIRKTSTIIVPRRVVKINKDVVKSAKKRRKPLYSVSSWIRASHIRRYRDEHGNVIKEIVVKEAVCNRKEEILGNSSDVFAPKRIFKISTEAMSKATKQ